MSDYKSLTDDELVNQEHAMFAPRGLTHSQMYALLLQQARRANALADAVLEHLQYVPPESEALRAKLGSYLGETND